MSFEFDEQPQLSRVDRRKIQRACSRLTARLMNGVSWSIAHTNDCGVNRTGTVSIEEVDIPMTVNVEFKAINDPEDDTLRYIVEQRTSILQGYEEMPDIVKEYILKSKVSSSEHEAVIDFSDDSSEADDTSEDTDEDIIYEKQTIDSYAIDESGNIQSYEHSINYLEDDIDIFWSKYTSPNVYARTQVYGLEIYDSRQANEVSRLDYEDIIDNIGDEIEFMNVVDGFESHREVAGATVSEHVSRILSRIAFVRMELGINDILTNGETRY